MTSATLNRIRIRTLLHADATATHARTHTPEVCEEKELPHRTERRHSWAPSQAHVLAPALTHSYATDTRAHIHTHTPELCKTEAADIVQGVDALEQLGVVALSAELQDSTTEKVELLQSGGKRKESPKRLHV